MRTKDDKKQEAICKAAIKLINDNGFEDTSISKIAREANVSPATIYTYFENKEELLNEVYLKVKRELADEMLSGLEEDMPVDEAFRLVWQNFYRYAVGNPAEFAFGEQFATSPLVNRLSKDQGLAYYESLVRLFERGKREGIFKDMPLAVFSAIAFFPVIGLIRQSYGNNLVYSDKIIEQVYEMAWQAVTTGGPDDG